MVVVVLGIVLGALFFSNGLGTVAEPARTTARSTKPETTPGSTPSRSSARSTPRSATPRSSSARPTSTARIHPTDVQYVNAGYTLPPVSKPVPVPNVQTQAQAQQVTRSNPLYSRTMAGPISCPYDPIDFQRDGIPRSQQLLEATYGCLMSAWASALRQAGYDFPRGPLHLVDKDFTTPCGDGSERVKIQETAGYYCPANMAIYMNSLRRAWYLPNGARTYRFEVVLAHEMGHHVQARAGILNASWAIQSQLKGEAALVMNRRLELQAQCFAGMAMAAMAHSYGITPEEMAEIESQQARLSTPRHGNERSLRLWFRTGLQAGGQIGRCNTFVVAASDVA